MTSLTLSVHALEGYSSQFVCLSVCVAVADLEDGRLLGASKRHEVKEYVDLSHFKLLLF